MSRTKLSGVKTTAFKTTRGTLVAGDGLTDLSPNTWYEIASVANTGSQLPIGVVTAKFRTPDTTETAITPVAGDNVYPLTLEKICKTDAEVNLEEGTIDVTDDCSGGYNDMILDGFKSVSGTLNGFLIFDDETGTILGFSEELIGRFFNVVTDDGAGTYTVTPAVNESFDLFILLNNNAEVGDVQNWLIVPVNISSFSTGSGLKDAQKRDISWTKAEGYLSLYKRTAFTDDILS